jgi:hypothetical protein
MHTLYMIPTNATILTNNSSILIHTYIIYSYAIHCYIPTLIHIVLNRAPQLENNIYFLIHLNTCISVY